ncbi:MAG: hypothetical protein J7L21_07485 [Sulfurimonas sp.]|nr:hypothetical protein [Sulfurimonas sp.]
MSGLVILISIVALVMHYNENVDKEEKHNIAIFPLLAIIFTVGFPLILSYETKVKIAENINYFKNNTPLECGSGFKLYIVSKDRDWQIVKKDSFTKNDLIIRADSCDLNKEISR